MKRTSRLRQTARQQTLPAEIGRLRLVEAIELLGRGRFARDVEHSGGFGLHAETHLEGLNAGLQFVVLLPQLLMLAIDRLDHVELITLLFASETLVDQILDRLLLDFAHLHAGVADGRSLHRARQEAGRPVLRRRRARAPA